MALAITFWDSYGLIVILVAICLAMMLFYFIKHKMQEKKIVEFEETLKVGDKVKTYSGFYGEISNITIIKEDENQIKVVTLKLGDNSFIDVDIRAIGQIDKRGEQVVANNTALDAKVAALRQKEDLAKRDQSKANAAAFRAAGQKQEAKVETPEEAAQAEQPQAEAAEQPQEAQQEQPEKKRFVAKTIERRSFATKPKDDQEAGNKNE